MTERDLFGARAVDVRALADLGRHDVGNAKRLKARFGEDLAWTPRLGLYVWDGRRWVADDDDSRARLLAQESAAQIIEEARAVERDPPPGLEGKQVDELVAAHLRWASQSQNSARISNAIAELKPHVRRDFSGWNADPKLFNAANGALRLDLDAFEFRPHRRDDWATNIAAVDYNEYAEAPRFRALMEKLIPDAETRAFLQRIFGACLGDAAHTQSLIIFHGGGGNGKSTVLNIIAAVLGDYDMTIAVESILTDGRGRKGSEASPDLARLAQRPRLVRTSEADVGSRLSEGTVKAVTGGEPIVARKLHQEPVEFVPNFLIILSVNQRPSIRGGDDGIWRRIKLVPWDVKLTPELYQELAVETIAADEGAGILNWLLQGWMDFADRARAGAPDAGLDPPEAVALATKSYRDDSDPVGRFLAECCTAGRGLEVEARDIYKAYERWCEDQDERAVTANLFGRRLTDRGIEKRESNGRVMRGGFALNDHGLMLKLRPARSARGAGGEPEVGG